MRRAISRATLALALFACGTTNAQPYPVRPVRLIVATVPGGGTDAIARIVGARLSELLGQPFVIDNRGGAGGSSARIPWRARRRTATRC